jgi:glycosyltransferase involved in cell wall biosynthesis
VVLGRGEIERFAAESGGCVHVESDPERLAAAFEALLKDQDRRERLGAAGRAYVVDRYSRASIAARLSDELESMVVTS